MHRYYLFACLSSLPTSDSWTFCASILHSRSSSMDAISSRTSQLSNWQVSLHHCCPLPRKGKDKRDILFLFFKNSVSQRILRTRSHWYNMPMKREALSSSHTVYCFVLSRLSAQYLIHCHGKRTILLLPTRTHQGNNCNKVSGSC